MGTHPESGAPTSNGGKEAGDCSHYSVDVDVHMVRPNLLRQRLRTLPCFLRAVNGAHVDRRKDAVAELRSSRE